MRLRRRAAVLMADIATLRTLADGGAPGSRQALAAQVLALRAELADLPERRRAAAAAAATWLSIAGGAVLVVEDDQANRFVLRHALEQEGYTVLTAATRSQALEALEALHSAAGHAPQLVLLDLLLPEMDGARVLEEYQQRWGAAAAPVVVVAGSRLTPAATGTLGAATLVAKPYDLDDLLALVASLTSN